MGGLPGDGRELPATKMSKGRLVVVVLKMVGRLVLGFLFILLIMSLVPKHPGDPIVYPIVLTIFGIVFYIWFFRRQVRGVYKSEYPTLRAIESLILVAAMFLAIFAMIYVMISISDTSAFTEPLSSFNSYYFSLTVLATVGFGDITPVTTVARSFTMVQMALDIAFIAVIIKVMSAAARRAIEQRAQRELEAEDRAKAQPGAQAAQTSGANPGTASD